MSNEARIIVSSWDMSMAYSCETVGQLRQIIEGLPDDAPIELREYRYRGGGDEYFTCDIVADINNGQLLFAPRIDMGVLGNY